MSLNVELLRSSFELVLEREPTLTHRFYSVLFTKYPQVKPLFGKNSGQHQEKMLAEIAYNDDAAFQALITQAKAALQPAQV